MVAGIASADYLTFHAMLSEGEVEGNLFAVLNEKETIQLEGLEDMEGTLFVEANPIRRMGNFEGLSPSKVDSVRVYWSSEEPDSQGKTITVSSMKIGSATDESSVSFCGSESMPMDKMVQLKKC